MGKMLSKKTSASKRTSTGIKLSPVKQISVDFLKPNPNNNYFAQEGIEYMTSLRRDIKERGIQVPLIAKKDGQLLAGHNRLCAARTLGITQVPVQFVEQALSPTEERDYVIKDNLMRRQLSPAERIQLYRVVYPEFDTRVLMSKPGTAKKFARMDPEFFLPQQKISEEMGVPLSIVRKDIAVLRMQDGRARAAYNVEEDDAIIQRRIRPNLTKCLRQAKVASPKVRQLIIDEFHNYLLLLKHIDTISDSVLVNCSMAQILDLVRKKEVKSKKKSVDTTSSSLKH